ncbi:MAG: NADH-quinone oxidoreductase subunit NuoE [Alphaproteobacteria bacterium]|nr:NADH-quinone oxidoreductase subunit NuoE [Alphaproteobacteria bacterium]
MSLRRLHHEQPASFAFNDANKTLLDQEIAKYPPGRQASAVIAALWIGQKQEGWVTKPMIEQVARLLDMPYIRVLEVATFYTMFNLEPVGQHMVQVCTTTPCWLRGSDAVVKACKKHIHQEQHAISADGKFTWMEVECLGACVNAPMILIDDDPYEDLDEQKTGEIIEAVRRGEQPKTGSQIGRRSSEPIGGPTTLINGHGAAAQRGGPANTDDTGKTHVHGVERESPAQKPPGAAT